MLESKIDQKNQPVLKKTTSVEDDVKSQPSDVVNQKERIRSSKGFAAPRRKEEKMLENMK